MPGRPWTREEDEMLRKCIEKRGGNPRKWSDVARDLGLDRDEKSCHFRWHNYLRPDLKKGKFSDEEIRAIVRLQARYGNRWSEIGAQLGGRSGNEIKNLWHNMLRKSSLQASSLTCPPLHSAVGPSSQTPIHETAANNVDYQRWPAAACLPNSASAAPQVLSNIHSLGLQPTIGSEGRGAAEGIHLLPMCSPEGVLSVDSSSSGYHIPNSYYTPIVPSSYSWASTYVEDINIAQPPNVMYVTHASDNHFEQATVSTL